MRRDLAGPPPARNGARASDPDLGRVVWSLAWPVIASLFSEAAVGLVDMLMVGRLGANAVAAVGVGAQILGSVSVVTMAVGTGTVALVARHVGAGEPARARRVTGQSLLAGFGLACLAILPVLAWAEEVVRLFGVEPGVVGPATVFTRLVMLSIPGGAVLFVVGSALRAAGDTRTPLAIGLVVNVVNVVLNYVLIFGALGLPALGVRGSALASTTAFTVGAAIGVALLALGRLRVRIGLGDLVPDRQLMLRVVRIGAPTGLEQLAMQLGFLVYLVFASAYGTAAVAAYFIGVRILALSFLPGVGFATAAAALVGQNLGAGDPERATEAGRVAMQLAVRLMSAAGLLLVVFAGPIARLFVADAAVVEDTRWFIYMLGLCQPLMAIDYALGGALRGAGDTRFPLATLFVGLYGCRLLFAWTATHALDLALPWLWAALLGDYGARAALKSWRYRGGAWQRVRL
jgi:putative MATE family efflux protein